MTPRAHARRGGKIRYAVVGLGHIAQVAVLPAFTHAKRNSALHAIVSGDPEKLADVGDLYDVPIRGGYNEFERCLEDVDAVYIATPNSEHARFAIRAAAMQRHVLCEKPLAVTDAECEAMIRSCQEANVKLMTAYRLHFEPLTLEVLDLISRGRIGDPRFFCSSFSMHTKPGGIRTQKALGGGTLGDLGVYCINAARLAFSSEPTQVFAYSVNGARSGMPEIDEMTAAVMNFDDGRLATFTTSFAAADSSDNHVVGTEGDIRVSPAYEYAEPLRYELTVDGRTTTKKGKRHDQFAAELLYFSDCILDDRAPEPSADEGAWEVRIVDALYESARRGEPIALRRFGPEDAPDRHQAIALPGISRPKMVNVESPHEE